MRLLIECRNWRLDFHISKRRSSYDQTHNTSAVSQSSSGVGRPHVDPFSIGTGAPLLPTTTRENSLRRKIRTKIRPKSRCELPAVSLDAATPIDAHASVQQTLCSDEPGVPSPVTSDVHGGSDVLLTRQKTVSPKRTALMTDRAPEPSTLEESATANRDRDQAQSTMIFFVLHGSKKSTYSNKSRNLHQSKQVAREQVRKTINPKNPIKIQRYSMMRLHWGMTAYLKKSIAISPSVQYLILSHIIFTYLNTRSISTTLRVQSGIPRHCCTLKIYHRSPRRTIRIHP
jgi:hypothetical protein